MAAIPHYHIVMDPEDWAWLKGHVGTERCFAGRLEVGGESRPLWIGYRGRYSRWFRKPSFDIWFDGAAGFRGHDRLHLNATYRDPSMLRSRLAFEVFADLGVPVPAAWHLLLSINGQPAGLYTAVESLNASWLRRRGVRQGIIYYGVGSGGHFGLLDQDTHRPKRFLATGYEKCYPYDDDHSQLEELIRAITLPEPAAFASDIDKLLDVEGVLRWFIGLEFMDHTDGFVQNYAIFRPDGGRWQISPWDCDGTWGRVPDGHRFGAEEMSIASGRGNYLLARLLNSQRWWERYIDLWVESLNGPLQVSRIGSHLRPMFLSIQAEALADPLKRYTDRTFLNEAAYISRYVKQRGEYVRARLASLDRSRPGGR